MIRKLEQDSLYRTRRSLSHVMAQAVQELHPQVRLGIGHEPTGFRGHKHQRLKTLAGCHPELQQAPQTPTNSSPEWISRLFALLVDTQAATSAALIRTTILTGFLSLTIC
jgi:hypothetical protein